MNKDKYYEDFEVTKIDKETNTVYTLVIKKPLMHFFEGSHWVLKNGIWVNYSAQLPTTMDVKKVLASENNTDLGTVDKWLTHEMSKGITTESNKRILFVCKNGYMDTKLNWHPDEIPFTTSQLKIDYIPNSRNAELDKYLDWMTNGDIDKRKSLLATCMTLVTRRNDGTLGILYSKNGGTGKTQFVSLYKRMGGGAVKSVSSKTLFGGGEKFNLTGSKGKTGVIGDEIPEKLDEKASDLIKDIIDPGKESRGVEDKGENMDETDNFLNLVFTTNRISTWYNVDHALESRVNVVEVSPEEGTFFPEDDFIEIRNDEKALEALLAESVEHYREAKKGWRAAGFRFGLDDTATYFSRVALSNSFFADVLDTKYEGKTFYEHFAAGDIELNRDGFRKLFDGWKMMTSNKMGYGTFSKQIADEASKFGILVTEKRRNNVRCKLFEVKDKTLLDKLFFGGAHD